MQKTSKIAQSIGYRFELHNLEEIKKKGNPTIRNKATTENQRRSRVEGQTLYQSTTKEVARPDAKEVRTCMNIY